ncbi:Uncharacterized protein F54H12.2 [Trachymyrmex cornetzi]|uniref:Uncharacterized protein F54H12.2 n=1 Tax=Trachymyrmex cornetzi TaxID=471704 RepID=A0A151J213_9HYME|nr:Uncharacterized protein F54H12.2 [Trachymyrmex cornetzi]
MSFLHTHSSECIKSELNFFSLPPTQTSIESSQWIYYKPVTSLTDDSPIEFVIPSHGEDYLDLTHTMLSLRIRVESERGESTSVAAADVAKVGPVNHLLHSMFNQIDVYFNQKLVSPPNNAYAYRVHRGVINFSGFQKSARFRKFHNIDISKLTLLESSASSLEISTRDKTLEFTVIFSYKDWINMSSEEVSYFDKHTFFDSCVNESHNAVEGVDINPYYCPAMAQKIKYLLPYFPLYSGGVMIPKFGFSKINASSSAVESEFNDIKHRLLKYNSQSMRIDKFLTLHIQFFSGKAKLAMSEINRPVLPSTSNINMHYDMTK